MLRSGVMEKGAVTRDVTGTPQGGVIYPVCATSTYTGSTGSGQNAGTGCWSVSPTYADLGIGRLMPSLELCRAAVGIARGCWGWLVNPRHNPPA